MVIATSKSILLMLFLWLYTQLSDLLGKFLSVEWGLLGTLLFVVLAVRGFLVGFRRSSLWARGHSWRGSLGLRSTRDLFAPLAAE